MHEWSICQGLISQLQDIAKQHRASAVDRVEVQAGPLSGVEPALLSHAFEIARCATVAEHAKLVISVGQIVVRCRSCTSESEAKPNQLLCAHCNDWQVDVIRGTELLLGKVELSGIPDGPAPSSGSAKPSEERPHV
jgi:hydrogenase nickel incorporation protein HypA/HybF